MDLGLAERVFLVTAGSAGLGRATAEQLVAEGARVVLVARRAELLAEAVSRLGPDRAVPLAADLADAGTAERACALALDTFGRLDGALISVGGPPAGSVLGTTEEQWRRAYQEISEFERALVDDGMILVKFWLHLSEQEQLRRFERRQHDPLKQWKLTDEDWRNRDKRPAYEDAVEDMLDRTDTAYAPWSLVEGDSKRWARVKVAETVIAAIEDGMRSRGFEVPPPPAALVPKLHV